MQTVKQPTQYPTRATMVAALAAVIAVAERNPSDMQVPTDAAQLVMAARQCGYITTEQGMEIENKYLPQMDPNFLAFLKDIHACIEANGSPDDVPVPTVIDKTLDTRYALVAQFRTIISFILKGGVSDLAKHMVEESSFLALVSGFVTPDQLTRELRRVHPEMKRGSGTPASMIAFLEGVKTLIENAEVEPELIRYSADAPETPESISPIAQAYADQLFGARGKQQQVA